MMNRFLKLIGFERRGWECETYHFKWGEFSWHPKKWTLSLRYCNFGCESHDMIILSPLVCSIYINTSEEYDRPWDDDGFSYGFYIYEWYSLVLSWGKKSLHWDFPFKALNWFKTEIYDVGGNLKFVETQGDERWDERYEIQNAIKVPYSYEYIRKNGDVQNTVANVHVSKMFWKRKWFPFLVKTKTCIDVDFKDQVGEGVDDWKGGCISCGYEIKDGETPGQCLRRMERERRFER
jgi:hypothetical protein